jgi:S1-C subfamily serine protease
MKLKTKMVGIFIVISMVCGLGCSSNNCLSQEAEYEVEDVVVQLTGSHDSTLNSSRSATFRMTSIRPNGIAVGTATLFSYKGKQIVVTAAHVVRGATQYFIESRYEAGVERRLKLIYYDEVADIAIMIPTTKIETIKPIKLRSAKSKHMYVGTKTIYSGYPNNHSMLTIHGRISGFTNSANLILDTYGWGGASGSSVFDEKGRLLGILSAMDVGTGMYGMPRLIPDVIIIIPATKIDFTALDLLLDK